MGKKRRGLNAPSKIALSFIGLILLGSFLLCTPIANTSGVWWNYLDALFTSTSAVCVTGLIVADTAVQFTLFGQIVLLFLIQIGGLGFISISALIILAAGKKLSYKNRVVLQESLNKEDNQGVVVFIKQIATIVFCVEGVGFILLLPSMIVEYGGAGIFKALFLSVSAFCNAGFDVIGTTGTQFQSLAPFAKNVFVLLPIMFLVINGGVGYIVILECVNRARKGVKKQPFSIHTKIVLWVTTILIVLGAGLFALFEWNNSGTIGNMSVFEKIMNSIFQSVTPRTAGFATIDQAKLTSSSRLVTDILMFIGGSPSSVAGGVKTTSIFVLLLYAFRSSGEKGDIVIGKKSVSHKTIQKALRIVALAVILAIIGIVSILLVERNNPLATSGAVIFEVLSAISTVGVTLGLTPTLGIAAKLILMNLMFIGRVGSLTLTFAIKHKSRDAEGLIQYQDAKIIVG